MIFLLFQVYSNTVWCVVDVFDFFGPRRDELEVLVLGLALLQELEAEANDLFVLLKLDGQGLAVDVAEPLNFHVFPVVEDHAHEGVLVVL